MALSINSRVVATRDHVSCELEGEAVILTSMTPSTTDLMKWLSLSGN